LEGNGVKPAAPGKPAWKLSASSITVSWEEVALAESYHLYYGTSPALPKKAAYSGGETTLDISDFANGTAYYAWVYAENERGPSPFSEAGIITPVLPAPEPVVQGGDRSITVSWEPVSLAASYNLYYAESDTPPETPFQSGITETASVTITGLVNETAYYVWTEAVNAGGSTMSNAVYVVTSPLPEPGEPVLQGGNGRITVSWEPVLLADSYNLYYSTDPNNKGSPWQSGIAGTTVTITGLANDTVYYVWVEAVNTGGSRMSNAVYVVTSPLPEPGEPALQGGKGSITVSWELVPLADSYNLYYSTDPNDKGSLYRSGLTGITPITITGLANDTSYYVWVEAVNAGGTKASAAKSVATLALPAPVPVLTPEKTGITVSWKKIELADSYNVYYSTDPNAKENPWQSGVTETTPVTITGLANGTIYYVWVEAVNAGGTRMSVAKSVATLALPAPVPAVTPGKSSITVSWEKIELADSYNLYYSTDPGVKGNPWQSGITETAPITITGLVNDTAYYVWVEAVNVGGTRMSAVVPVWPGDPVLPGHDYMVSSESAFTQAVNAIKASSTAGNYRIILTSNVSADNVALSASTGAAKVITILGDTAPRTITNTGSAVLFTVATGTTLVLGNNIKLDGNEKSYSLVRINGGTLVMRAKSAISGAKANAVYISQGAFVMEGGEISGNTGSFGGGVNVSSGTFTMSGGTINGNTGSSGGGVYVSSGASFTMSGGEISGNTASSKGGGVYVSSGTFIMEGGTISGNIATKYDGGGVLNSGGTFTMSGGTISGNTATSDGGGVLNSGGTFTMSGGTISGNTATKYDGGGVYISHGRFTKSGGGIIDGTNSATSGKVVYVYSSPPKQRNAAAGPGVDMDSNINGSAGGWEL
jgi:fibronectin type 3 domain-containing protein